MTPAGAVRSTDYDRVGATYSATRHPDPRIAAAVAEALGDARTLVNVGAGTGSYEPSDRPVVAVEPSGAMIRQRAARSAPCVQGIAEGLPFGDGAVDASLAVMTIHHWRDQTAGLAELRRIARRRVIVLTWDPGTPRGAFWRRPEAYLDPAVRGGISSFAQSSPADLRRGLARLAEDLRSGRWEARHGALRERASLDLGYRLIVAERD